MYSLRTPVVKFTGEFLGIMCEFGDGPLVYVWMLRVHTHATALVTTLSLAYANEGERTWE